VARANVASDPLDVSVVLDAPFTVLQFTTDETAGSNYELQYVDAQPAQAELDADFAFKPIDSDGLIGNESTVTIDGELGKGASDTDTLALTEDTAETVDPAELADQTGGFRLKEGGDSEVELNDAEDSPLSLGDADPETGEQSLTPDSNFSGDTELGFNLVQTSADGQARLTTTGTVAVEVAPVTDMPEISVTQGAVTVEVLAEGGGSEKHIALSVESALTDTDGSEQKTVAVNLSSLPEGVRLQGADGLPISAAEGEDASQLVLSEAQLAGLTLVVADGASYSGELSFTARAQEGGTDDIQSAVAAISLADLSDIAPPQSEDFALVVDASGKVDIDFSLNDGGLDRVSDEADDRSTADNKETYVLITELPEEGVLWYDNGENRIQLTQQHLYQVAEGEAGSDQGDQVQPEIGLQVSLSGLSYQANADALDATRISVGGAEQGAAGWSDTDFKQGQNKTDTLEKTAEDGSTITTTLIAAAPNGGGSDGSSSGGPGNSNGKGKGKKDDADTGGGNGSEGGHFKYGTGSENGQGYGLADQTGGGINDGDVIEVDFGQTVTDATIGLSSISSHFATDGHNNGASAEITAYLDGEVVAQTSLTSDSRLAEVGLDVPFDTLQFTTDADMGNNGPSFKLDEISASTDNAVVDDSFQYQPVDSDGLVGNISTVTLGGGVTLSALPENSGDVAASTTLQLTEDQSSLVDSAELSALTDGGFYLPEDSSTQLSLANSNSDQLAVRQGEGGLIVTPDPDFSGDTELSYQRTEVAGSDGDQRQLTSTGTIAVEVTPVVDSPELSVQAQSIDHIDADEAEGTVAHKEVELELAATLEDTDGSEQLGAFLDVSQLADDAVVVIGDAEYRAGDIDGGLLNLKDLDNAEGVANVDTAALAQTVKVRLADGDEGYQQSLQVISTATEMATGDTRTETQTVHFDQQQLDNDERENGEFQLTALKDGEVTEAGPGPESMAADDNGQADLRALDVTVNLHGKPSVGYQNGLGIYTAEQSESGDSQLIGGVIVEDNTRNDGRTADAETGIYGSETVHLESGGDYADLLDDADSAGFFILPDAHSPGGGKTDGYEQGAQVEFTEAWAGEGDAPDLKSGVQATVDGATVNTAGVSDQAYFSNDALNPGFRDERTGAEFEADEKTFADGSNPVEAAGATNWWEDLTALDDNADGTVRDSTPDIQTSYEVTETTVTLAEESVLDTASSDVADDLDSLLDEALENTPTPDAEVVESTLVDDTPIVEPDIAPVEDIPAVVTIDLSTTTDS